MNHLLLENLNIYFFGTKIINKKETTLIFTNFIIMINFSE